MLQSSGAPGIVARDARPRIAATLAPLLLGADAVGVRDALAWVSAAGYLGVQLSATDAPMRPRDLSESARRDLAATLARSELLVAGLDFLIPPAHFSDPARVGKAIDAGLAAIGLAARLGRAPLTVPGAVLDAPDAAAALAGEAERCGVRVALAGLEASLDDGIARLGSSAGSHFDVALDCAAALAAGLRPEEVVTRLGASGAPRLGAVRLVDLLRSGLRGPLLEPGEARLDALALRVALEVTGFDSLPVVDARQWSDPRRGLAASVERWARLVAA